MKLVDCPNCGGEVEMRYICGMDKNLQYEFPLSKTKPQVYVLCQHCGENLFCEIRKSSIEAVESAKKKLVREWNKKMSAENRIYEVRFIDISK